MPIPVAKAPLLEGKRGLIIGIANERSIGWGCARAFRALGAELSTTYAKERTRQCVEPLAREAGAAIFMPMNVQIDGQMEAVFDTIAAKWGKLDFVVHCLASAPKEALRGRAVDIARDGFLSTVDVTGWSFFGIPNIAN